MSDFKFEKHLKFGNSRRKVTDLSMYIFDLQKLGCEEYAFKARVTGVIEAERELKAISVFDCFTLGCAFLRQNLRRAKQANPKLKFFDDVVGELLELSIDEIFRTDDCIPEDYEEILDWSKNNGYELE